MHIMAFFCGWIWFTALAMCGFKAAGEGSSRYAAKPNNSWSHLSHASNMEARVLWDMFRNDQRADFENLTKLRFLLGIQKSYLVAWERIGGI